MEKEELNWRIENIAEASKNARTIYFIYIVFLVFCALTLFSTTDRQLILNDSTVRLPLINLDLSLNGFFLVAPIMATFIFMYFQFYFVNLNKLVSELNSAVDKRRLYPWFFNYIQDREPSVFGILQNFTVQFSLWWSLPLVLSLFSLQYIKKHDLLFSYILSVLLLFGCVIVVMFRSRVEYIRDNAGLETKKWCWICRKHISKYVFIFFVLVFFSVYIYKIIPKSIRGELQFFTGNLSYQILITKPDIDYAGLYWVNLKGVHLEGANLNSAVLKRADLTEAHLQKASLISANCEQTDLKRANLEEAMLWKANLAGADLRGAKVGHSSLIGVDLQGATLQGADLRSVNFAEAKLDGADFDGANLYHAQFLNVDLRGVKNLTYEQLSTVLSLYKAILDEDIKNHLQAEHPHLFKPPGPPN